MTCSMLSAIIDRTYVGNCARKPACRMAAKDFLADDGVSTRIGFSSFIIKGISGFDWRGLNCGLARSPSDDLRPVVRAGRHHCSGPVRITDMQPFAKSRVDHIRAAAVADSISALILSRSSAVAGL